MPLKLKYFILFRPFERYLCVCWWQSNIEYSYIYLKVPHKDNAHMTDVYIRFIRKKTSVDKPLLEYMNKKLNTR